MGLTCNYEGKKADDLGDLKRPSFQSKSCNDNFNFSPIDNDNNDDDEKRDSKKDNAMIKKSKNIKSSKSNPKNNDQIKNKYNRKNSQRKNTNKSNKEIPKIIKNNSHNDGDNNNEDNNDDNRKDKVNDNDKEKSYLDFNNNSRYYIICPDCKNKVPTIKDAAYDANRNDFIIEYFCNCIPDGDDKKSYLINFISNKRPENIAYSFESLEKLKSMLDTVKDKQDEFQGFQILDKIYKELNNLRKKMSYNKSVAPPANMQKSLVEPKNN